MTLREGRNGGKLKSGNTVGVGRPKMPDLREAMAKILAQEKDGYTALDTILAVMKAKAEKGDVKAAEFLFDRGFGKPTQDISMRQEGTTEVTIRVIEGNE